MPSMLTNPNRPLSLDEMLAEEPKKPDALDLMLAEQPNPLDSMLEEERQLAEAESKPLTMFEQWRGQLAPQGEWLIDTMLKEEQEKEEKAFEKYAPRPQYKGSEVRPAYKGYEIVETEQGLQVKTPRPEAPGKKGFVTAFFQDPSKFGGIFTSLPRAYDDYQAMRAAMRLKDPAFDWDDYANRTNKSGFKEWLGDMGFDVEATTNILGGEIPQRTKEGLAALDLQTLNKYAENILSQQAEDYTVPGRIGQAMGQLPGWMIDIWATSGFYNLLKKPVQVAVEKQFKGYITGKIAGAVTGAAAGSALRTAALPHRVFQDAVARYVIQGKSGPRSFAEAFGATYIEALSEEAGKGMTWGAEAATNHLLMSKFAGPYVEKIFDIWHRANPAKNTLDVFVDIVLRKGGWSGLLPELGEEYLASAMHAVVGTEDFGLGPESGPIDRFIEAMKQETENLYVTVPTLAAPGAMKLAPQVQYMLRKKAAVELVENMKQLMLASQLKAADKKTYAERYDRAIEAIRQGRTATLPAINTDEHAGIAIATKMYERIQIPEPTSEYQKTEWERFTEGPPTEMSREEWIQRLSERHTRLFLELRRREDAGEDTKELAKYIGKITKQLEAMKGMRPGTYPFEPPALTRRYQRENARKLLQERLASPTAQPPRVEDLQPYQGEKWADEALAKLQPPPEEPPPEAPPLPVEKPPEKPPEKPGPLAKPPSIMVKETPTPSLQPRTPPAPPTPPPEEVTEKPPGAAVTAPQGKPITEGMFYSAQKLAFDNLAKTGGRWTELKATPKSLAQGRAFGESLVRGGVVEDYQGVRWTVAETSEGRFLETVGTAAGYVKIDSDRGADILSKSRLITAAPSGEIAGQTVYRSSKTAFDAAQIGEDGIFVSPDKSWVEGWQKSQKRTGPVEELVISPEANILRRENIPDKFITEKDGWSIVTLDDQKALGEYTKENGFDGYENYDIAPDGKKMPSEFVIFNPDVIQKPAPQGEMAAEKAPPEGVTEKPAGELDIGDYSERTKPKIKERMAAGPPIKKNELTQWATELGQKRDEKWLQEAAELSVVKIARDIEAEDVSDEEKLQALQNLYDNQPVLGARTSTSIERQAYSTPAPVAHVVTQLVGITPETTVYEPTAGTGMLLIAAKPENVWANEIDETRAETLTAQGFRVTSLDAMEPSDIGNRQFDVVVANPPFGAVPHPVGMKAAGQNYLLSRKEHIIAARALEKMKDDGRAVIIVGAAKAQGKESTPNWVFGNYLKALYNIEDDFELSGDFYTRQGAGWPIRIIVIAGRKTKQVPAAKDKLAEIKQRLDEAYKKNDLKEFSAIIDKELAPLPSSFEKNSLQGIAQTLLMEMENRQAKKAEVKRAEKTKAEYPEEPGTLAIVSKKRVTFQRSIIGENGERESVPTLSYLVRAANWPDIDFHLYHSAGGWYVAEPKTGLIIEMQKSRKQDEALRLAFERLAQNGRARTLETIEKSLERMASEKVEPKIRGIPAEPAKAEGKIAAQEAAKGKKGFARFAEYQIAKIKTMAESFGLTVSGGGVESGSYYIRVNHPEIEFPAVHPEYGQGPTRKTTFRIRISNHPAKLQPSISKFDLLPGNEKEVLEQIQLEMYRRSKGGIYSPELQIPAKQAPSGPEGEFFGMPAEEEQRERLTSWDEVKRRLAGKRPAKAEKLKQGIDWQMLEGLVRKPKAKPISKAAAIKEFTSGVKQVPYKPKSRGPYGAESVSLYLLPHIEAALSRLESFVGDIDSYVAREIGYQNNEEMWKYLNGVQVDTVALAIYRLDSGGALVVGHQTGLGKGRVLAALLRREIQKGRAPIFITAKPNLYSDFYRDLEDVGLDIQTVNPIVTNVGAAIYDKKGNAVFEKHANRSIATAAYREAIKSGDYSFVMTTYSQINSPDRIQQAQVAGVAEGQLLILDESHNAAGESQTGTYISNLLNSVGSAVFSSATFAKTPATMALYGRTGLLDAFDNNPDAMEQAMRLGGEPFKELVAAAMARASAYIRFEMDFSGIEFPVYIDEEHKERDGERADLVTDQLRAIIGFDEALAEWVKKQRGRRIETRHGPSTTVEHTHFAAHAHNAIRQLLLTLKTPQVIEHAIKAVKEGKRVIVALDNTLGTFLNDYVKTNGITAGSEVKGFDYRALLDMMLKRVLRYTERAKTGEKQVHTISLDELSPELRRMYLAIEEAIADLKVELTGSPIDEMHWAFKAAGIKSAELTGRNLVLEKNKKGDITLEHRPKESRNPTLTVNEFNNGSTQILIANRSSAEGISAHSSKTFKNQEQRLMIVAQSPLNITEFLQMLGRVNRTGQAQKPLYETFQTALPSEIRPAAIQTRKMASLNALTSAKTKGHYDLANMPDFMNVYGDYLTAQYLLEHPYYIPLLNLKADLADYAKAMESGDYHGPWSEERISAKFTGKLALLSVAEQEGYYKWMDEVYPDLINELNQRGQNELVSYDRDYRAKEVKSQDIFKGNASNVFLETATLDLMDIKKEGRAHTVTEIRQAQKETLAGKKQDEWSLRLWQQVATAWSKYLDSWAEERKITVEELKGKAYYKMAREAYETSKQAFSQLDMREARMLGEDVVYLLGVKSVFDKERYFANPAAPSAIRLRVAVSTAAKEMTIPLSRWRSLRPAGEESARTAFEKAQHPREERYIINGNLIAGMGRLIGPTGQRLARPEIINYTMEDGSIRMGLLLPRHFDPSTQLNKRTPLDAQQAAEYLLHVRGAEVLVTPNDLTLEKRGGDIIFNAPSAKSRGAKYYLDMELRRLTGDFSQGYRSPIMTARFKEAKLLPVLKWLKDKGHSFFSHESHSDELRGTLNLTYGRPQTKTPARPGEPPIKKSLEDIRAEKKRGPQAPWKVRQYLSRVLGIPIRGKATYRGRRAKMFAGWYAPREREIRIIRYGDLRAITHEVGHDIDEYFNHRWASGHSIPADIAVEMIALGRDLYGAKSGVKLPASFLAGEGYAEFIRLWLFSKDEHIEKVAPLTLRHFINDYFKSQSEMAEILKTARGMLKDYHDQGAEKRFDAQMLKKPPRPPIGSLWRRFTLWTHQTFWDTNTLHSLLREYLGERDIEHPTGDPAWWFDFKTQKAPAIAESFVMDYTADFFGGSTGIPLREAIAPVADQWAEFSKYIVARRAEVYEKRGLESGFDKDDVKYIIDKYRSEKFDKAVDEVTDWSRRLLDYVIQAGVLTKTEAQQFIDRNPVYIPFMRVFFEGENRWADYKGMGTGKISKAAATHKITGSQRPMYEFLDSMFLNAVRLVELANKNHLGVLLSKLESKERGLGGLMVRVPAPLKVAKAKIEDIQTQLEDMGIDVPRGLGENVVNIYRNASDEYKGREYIIAIRVPVFAKGKSITKVRYYQVNPQLYHVLKGMDTVNLGKLWQVLTAPTRLQRLGWTGLNPAWGLLANSMRDTQDAAVKARHLRGMFRTVPGLFRGIGADIKTTELGRLLGLKPDKEALELIAMGIRQATFLGQDRSALAHIKGMALANSVGDHVIQTVEHPVHALRSLFNIPETGLRIAEYKAALDYWMKKYHQTGEPPPDAKMYAFLKAQDMTINFTRHGVLGKYINQLIPFWNSSVQDLNLVAKLIREDPMGFFMRGFAYLTIPTLAIWWLGKDEEWWKNLDDRDKANNTHFLIPGTKTVVRIPVPYVVGHLFSSIPKMALDAMYRQDLDGVKRALKEVFDQDITPVVAGWDIALIAPIVDVAMNKTYAGRPLVPADLENKVRGLQFTEYTLAATKAVADVLNKGSKYNNRISPIVLEHVINQYSGGLYRRTVGGIEKIAKGPEKWTPAEYPVTGRFAVREPQKPRAQITRFYEEWRQLQKIHASKLPNEDATRYRTYSKVAEWLGKQYKELRAAKTQARKDKIYAEIGRTLEYYKKENK